MKITIVSRFFTWFLSLLACALLLTSCVAQKPQPPKPLPVGEGRLAVPGGTIWYKVSGSGSGIPVVLLHGGPGMSSYYVKPFEDLQDDRQVIRYDQLGGGKSDKITDTTMFTIDHFVRELDSLRAYLGVERWHLLGHSWGTILAVEYYRAYPDRVASLTLGSACLDIAAYERHARELLATLPQGMQAAVRKAEARGKYDDAGYQKAMEHFYALYVYRHPVKEDLDSTFATISEAIYGYMQGPSEFTITGTLKNYDSTPFLSRIKVPTLFTVGEFDEVGPELVKGFAAETPHARLVQFAGSAHITCWDARDENVKVVREFLRSADSLAAGERARVPVD
ncbi:MAG: proline iminopeptidase-family hydrolase [Bacteroidota bacterium]